MATSAFRAGAEILIDGAPHALLRRISDTIWQIEEKSSLRIKEVTDDTLRSQYASGKLIFLTEKAVLGAPGKNHRDLTKEAFEVAKTRRAYVMAVLELPASKELFGPIIEEIWAKVRQPKRPPSFSTVMRWRAAFIASGRDVTSLLQNDRRKGNRVSRYPKEVMNLVTDVIENKYLSLERRSIQDVLDEAIIRVQRENEMRPSSLRLPIPTRRLVTRLIEAIPAFEKYAARYGRAAAMRKFRSVQGHRVTASPLERAEIDHTPLDLLVLDDRTGLPLGRPYLTGCIDDFSRCILGMFLSFEPPSYLTVARCLRDAFLPKAWLRERYPCVSHDWDAHGVMRELVVDNGAEFHSDSLEAACWSLGIEIHYAPRKTGWFKAKIERFLGTMNRGVAHGTPGTTFSNIFEKDEYDPSKHAVVRLGVLQEVIRIWVVDYYHQKPHRTLGIPPAHMWASNIRPEDILVPDDPARLDAILGRAEGRVLSHRGIELDGLFYNSPELTALRMKHGDHLDVELRIDDSDIGKIVVLAPDKTQMFEVRCLSFEYADGLSRWQHKVCKRFAAGHFEKSNPMAWLKAKETIARIIDEEFSHKRRKSAKRLARYQSVETAQLPKPATSSVTQERPVSTRTEVPEPPLISVSERPSELPPVEVSPPESPPKAKKRFAPVFRDRCAATSQDFADDEYQ